MSALEDALKTLESANEEELLALRDLFRRRIAVIELLLNVPKRMGRPRKYRGTTAAEAEDKRLLKEPEPPVPNEEWDRIVRCLRERNMPLPSGVIGEETGIPVERVGQLCALHKDIDVRLIGYHHWRLIDRG